MCPQDGAFLSLERVIGNLKVLLVIASSSSSSSQAPSAEYGPDID